MSKFINVNLTNQTTEDIDLETNNYLRGNIVNSANNYEASITKLYIPVSKIKLLKKSDMTDYYVSFLKTDGSSYHRATNTLYTDSQMSIYSLKDFVENLNRTLLKTYDDWMYEVDNASVLTLNATHNFTSVSTTDTVVCPATSHTHVCHVKFVVNSITNNNSNQIPFRIRVTSPLGTTCDIANGTNWNLPDTDTKTYDLTFDDSSPNNYPQSVGGFSTSTSYQSLQGTSIFSLDATINGNWTVECIPTYDDAPANLDIDMDYDLVLTRCFMNSTSSELSNLVPAFSYDDSTGKVSLIYSELLHASNTRLGLSPKLANILNFESQYNSTYDEYYIDYPHRVWSAGLDQTETLVQNRASIERVANLNRIEVVSSALRVESEVNNDNTSSNVITSFHPLFDNELSDLRYDYNSATHPYRSYPLKGNTGIDKIDISAYTVYDDETRERIRLRPSDKFYCTIVLTPVPTYNIDDKRPELLHQGQSYKLR